jgi:hypothetical protein
MTPVSEVFRVNPESIQSLESISLTGSPVTLQANWVRESKKFFDAEQLRVRLWTQEKWENDMDVCTVWVVKVSLLHSGSPFHKLLCGFTFDNDIEITSTWSDEAHQFGRGFESAQIQILRKSVFVRSHFNVIITGTLFPLGPETDANGVLQTIGGRYDDTGKWSGELARSFLRLVGGGKRDPKIFQTLALRIFMAPFTLRRTSSSTWFGEWVIQRVWSRPEPEIVLPFPDDETSDLAKQFVRVPRNKDKTDLSLK